MCWYFRDSVKISQQHSVDTSGRILRGGRTSSQVLVHFLFYTGRLFPNYYTFDNALHHDKIKNSFIRLTIFREYVLLRIIKVLLLDFFFYYKLPVDKVFFLVDKVPYYNKI